MCPESFVAENVYLTFERKSYCKHENMTNRLITKRLIFIYKWDFNQKCQFEKNEILKVRFDHSSSIRKIMLGKICF